MAPFYYYLAWVFLGFTTFMILFTLYLGWQHWKSERNRDG